MNNKIVALYVYNVKKTDYEKPVLARIIDTNAHNELIIETDFLPISPLWENRLEAHYADYGLMFTNRYRYVIKSHK